MPSLMKARSGVLNSNIGGNALAPLFSTGALTIANAITDVTRLAGVQGDGAAYPDSSVGVWPAATNLVTNGNATTNTTGWTLGGTASLARVTDDGKFGTTCFKWTIGATPAGDGNFCAATLTGATTGRTFTISRWLKGVGGSVGKTVRLVSRESGGASGTATVVIAEFTLTSDWQLCSVTGSVTANDRTSLRNDIIIGSTGTPVTTADEIKFGGVSIFESAINMPYIETDGGTASRVVGTMTMPASVLDETQMWVAFRMRMGYASTQNPATPGSQLWFTWGDPSPTRRIGILSSGTSGSVRTQRYDGTTIASAEIFGTWAIGDYVTVLGGVSATEVKLALNGGAITAAAHTAIPVLDATTAQIGGNGGVAALGAFPATADYKWFAAGKGPIDNAFSTLINAWGNNDPLPHMFPRSAQLTFLAHFNGDGAAYRYAA